jgi:hypothetical protein
MSSQRAVKAVDAHTFIKQAEKFKQAVSARKQTAPVFWNQKDR